MDSPTQHRRNAAVSAQELRQALPQALDACSAHWQPEKTANTNGDDASWAGTLTMPVAAGLRQGEMQGRLSAHDDENGSTLELIVEQSTYRVHMPALLMLSLAGLGALILLLAPLLMLVWPSVLNAVPLGILLALGGWFLVVSRLKTFQGDDFLKLLVELAEAPDSSS